jgi:hypothetical protein
MMHGPGLVLKPDDHTTLWAHLSQRLLVVVGCHCHSVSIIGMAARFHGYQKGNSISRFRLLPYVMSIKLPYLCTVCDTACSRR